MNPNSNTGTCAGVILDRACTEPPTMTVPVRLCDEHKVQVAALVVPGILSAALAEMQAGREGRTRTISTADAHIIASAQSAEMPEGDHHGVLVYFLANGGRVKIGFTKGLSNRLRGLSLREEAVLLLLHGGRPLELALHAKFDAYRIGDSEWFELSPEVVHFVADKSPKASTKRLTSRNKRRKALGEPVKRTPRPPRRTDAELIAELDGIVADHYRSHPGEEIKVQPVAKQLGIGRDRARALLDQMNVRPLRKAN